MIFLCFSVKDRVPLINDIYQMLCNFGLDIWYDRRNLYLGDDRYKENISHGVNSPKVNYAIVFYTDNLRHGNICLEEYSILEKRYISGEVHIFPVFPNEVPEEIDKRFLLCKELVFKQLVTQEDHWSLCLHIVAKITSDELASKPFSSIEDVILHYNDKDNIAYKLLIEYENISKENYSMRIGVLFSIYMLLNNSIPVNYAHYKTMHQIFYRNCSQPLRDERRELQIMENIIIYEFGSLR